MKENHLASTCTRTAFSIGYEEQGVLIWWHLMKENHLASRGSFIWWHLMKDNHLARTCTRTVFQEDGIYNWLRRAGGPYLVAFNEGEPPGKHLPQDGVFNWLRIAGGPLSGGI